MSLAERDTMMREVLPLESSRGIYLCLQNKGYSDLILCCFWGKFWFLHEL